MTYQAIINGARGLIFFGGHIPKAMTTEDAALDFDKPQFPICLNLRFNVVPALLVTHICRVVAQLFFGFQKPVGEEE